MDNPYSLAQAHMIDAIGQLLGDQLSKYKNKAGKQVPAIIDEDRNSAQLAYPFISLGIIDDYIPDSLDRTADYFKIDMQIKCLSNAKMVAKYLARQLNVKLNSYECRQFLYQFGISIVSMNALPSLTTATDTFNQYESGWDVILVINDSVEFEHGEAPQLILNNRKE